MNDGIGVAEKTRTSPPGKPNFVQRERIDAHVVIVELQHGAEVGREIVARASLDFPSGIQMTACVSHRLRKTSTQAERKATRFLLCVKASGRNKTEAKAKARNFLIVDPSEATDRGDSRPGFNYLT